MTDPRPPLSDEELSAILDGEAAPELLARFQGDPVAQQRLTALRSAGDLLRSSPLTPLEPAVVDDLVGRALAELDGGAAGAAGGPSGVVTPLTPPNPRRATGPSRWLVAAAVVVLCGVGLVLVWSGRDDGNGGNQETASDVTQQTGLAQAPDAGDQSAGAAPQGPPGLVVDLGTFPDKAALRAFLKTGFPSGRPLMDSAKAPRMAAVNRCSSLIHTVMESEGIADSPSHTGFATVAGKPYLVYEFEVTEAGAGHDALTSVADPTTCDVLATFVR